MKSRRFDEYTQALASLTEQHNKVTAHLAVLLERLGSKEDAMLLAHVYDVMGKSAATIGQLQHMLALEEIKPGFIDYVHNIIEHEGNAGDDDSGSWSRDSDPSDILS